MFSNWFLVWGAVSALIFVAVHFFALIPVGFSTFFFALLGFLLGTGLSFLWLPSLDFFLGNSLFLGLFVYWVAALLVLIFSERGTRGIPTAVGIALLAVTALLCFVTTHSSLNAEQYANLIVPKQEERDATMPLTDQSQVRLVTDQLARKRAAELLSSSDEQGIGSRVVIGEMWGNEINGKLYWIAPLEHSGFFRWMNFGTTPGYIMVSQFNEVDAKFVQDKPIKIGTGAYFSDNVYRRLYMNGYIDYDYGDAVFQVDDDGEPYWVVPMLYPQVGFSGYLPVKWVLVHATTGEMQEFNNAAEVPSWVDRVYPADIVAERFDDWGCLSNGYVACSWTGQNVISSTPGISVTINPDGDVVYYSGTQYNNASSEGASSGVYIANARTGEIIFYPRSGITEQTATSVMTQAYANYDGYHAAEALLVSINGMEAYFSVILDGSGVRKGFAIVAQDNRNIIGVGNSVQSTVTEFMRANQRSARDAAFEAGSKDSSLHQEGLVQTITPYSQNGRTVFYITIDSLPNKILEVSEEKVGEIVATVVGDPVSVGIENMDPGVVFVTQFDNLRIALEENGIQPIVDYSNSEALTRYKVEKERNKVSALLHTLSQEELDLVMQSYHEKRSKWRSGQ